MTPAITSCYVDDNSDYPTHRPLVIEVVTKLLESTCKERRKPTNFAWILNQKIEKEVDEALKKREEEKAKGNDDFKEEQEYSIRKRNLESLQKEMDIAVERRNTDSTMRSS